MAQQARPYPSGQTDLERDQFFAHFNMSARLVSCTGISWLPGVYSWGPCAMVKGMGLRRVPGTCVFSCCVFTLLIYITCSTAVSWPLLLYNGKRICRVGRGVKASHGRSVSYIYFTITNML